MVRDIYHQPVGNPLQFDRLPKSRPKMQLPYHPYSAAKDAWFAASLVSTLIAVALAGFGAGLMQIFVQQREAPPSLVGKNIILLACVLFLFAKALREQDIHWILTPAKYILVAAIFLSLRLPSTLQWFATCAALGLISWRFGRHWTFFCTASPLDRAAATQLRRNWTWFLTLVALAPVGVFILAHFVPGPFVQAMLLAGCVFQLILSVLAPGKTRVLR